MQSFSLSLSLSLPFQINNIGTYNTSLFHFQRNGLVNASFYLDSTKYPSYDFNFTDTTEISNANILGWLTAFSTSDPFLDQPYWPDLKRFEASYFILKFDFGVLDDNGSSPIRPVSKSGNCRLDLTFQDSSNGNLKIFLLQRYSNCLQIDSYRNALRNYVL